MYTKPQFQKVRMKRYLPLLTSLVLVACSSQHEDLSEWMQSVQHDSKMHVRKKAEPPTLPKPATYTPPESVGPNMYQSARLRMGTQKGNAPDLTRTKELLENYSLESIFYTGYLGYQGREPLAYVKHDDHTYTVKVGSYMGQHYGRISEITPEKIIVVEQVEDSYGNWINNPVEMLLNTPDQNTQK